MAPLKQVDRILARLSALHPKAIDLGLDRVEALLERLGAPQRALPPVVHVAGTNGKGSTIAFLRAILEASGYRVHVYTSPHLVRFAERIRVAGRIIPEAELEALLVECERANGETPITFFEITTAAAFLAFAREPADILLLETGLGGRLDATNVIERPALTAITPVSIDHIQYLGKELAGIAAEKAGILKPGVPCVVGRQSAEAVVPILARAEALGIPVALFGREWEAGRNAAGRLVVRDGAVEAAYPAPGLFGPHQFENAGLAVACARRLAGFELGEPGFGAGLRDADWPGRLQHLTRGTLVARLPAGWELWLDGGHNAGAGAALSRAVTAWSDAPLHLVIGMLDSKEPESFAAPLAPHAATIACVPVPDEPAGLAPEALCARLAGLGPSPEPAAGVAKALDRLAQRASRESRARVLVCGSLYLLGSVLAENEALSATA